MTLNKLQEIVKDREAWHAVVHGVWKLDTMEQLNSNGDKGPQTGMQPYQHLAINWGRPMWHFWPPEV